MITRRRFIVGAGTAGALGVALRVPATARARPGRRRAPRLPAVASCCRSCRRAPAARAAEPLRPPAPSTQQLLWRLGAYEILDPRRLDERLARWPAARIHAVVDGGNHLLLVDALRQHGGAILKQRWSPSRAALDAHRPRRAQASALNQLRGGGQRVSR